MAYDKCLNNNKGTFALLYECTSYTGGHVYCLSEWGEKAILPLAPGCHYILITAREQLAGREGARVKGRLVEGEDDGGHCCAWSIRGCRAVGGRGLAERSSPLVVRQQVVG